MFVKLEPMGKLNEPVRLELIESITKNAEKITTLGYRFDMQTALDQALQKVVKEQEKFIQKNQSKPRPVTTEVVGLS